MAQRTLRLFVLLVILAAAPAAAQTALYAHEEIEEAAVVAIPDDDAGVLIHAHISSVSGEKISMIKLKKFCSERLPVYMVPDRFAFHESLPKTSTDKIDYQGLKNG